MDSTTLVIIGIALLVLAGAALLMRRLNWGSSPGYTKLPDTAPPPSVLPDTASPPSVSAASALDPGVQSELSALLARGQKIEAIKRVRELTGLGLKEAKDYVEALAAGAPIAAPSAPAPHISTMDIEDEVRVILARGNKIEAIKRVRELTGLGLKEARDYIERLESGDH